MMNGHVVQYLEAYHDGELSYPMEQKVTEHLSNCKDCQVQLHRLEALSRTLQSAPPAPIMPEARFTAQVALRLPREQEEAAFTSAKLWVWRAIPLLLLSGWVFMQTLLWTTGVVQTLLPLTPAALPLPWLQTGGIWEFVVISMAVTTVSGLLFLSWLAAWWAGLTPGESRSISNQARYKVMTA